MAVLTTSPATAASSTCGTRGNYFDGMFYNPQDAGHVTRGVTGFLLVRPSASCTTDTGMFNFTNAWTLLSGASGGEHVQSGFIRKTSTSFTENFSQAVRGGTDIETKYVGTQLLEGERNQYEQAIWTNSLCSHSSRCAFSYAKGSLILISNWDPLTSWNGPFNVQYASETGYRESDVPGRATNKTEYTGLKYFTGENSTGAVTQPCGVTTRIDSSRWSQDRPACDQLRTWTATG